MQYGTYYKNSQRFVGAQYQTYGHLLDPILHILTQKLSTIFIYILLNILFRTLYPLNNENWRVWYITVKSQYAQNVNLYFEITLIRGK